MPGGFGIRGMEGKIATIQYARENGLPFLGICLGMQLAVVEFARHVCEISAATTREALQEGEVGRELVIDILPEQNEISQMGGTMRLGAQTVVLTTGSRIHKIYQDDAIHERFRHRYEVSSKYIPLMEQKGLVFSGRAKNREIMQIMELPSHPFFVGTQYHPELTSRLENPSKLFCSFCKSLPRKMMVF